MRGEGGDCRQLGRRSAEVTLRSQRRIAYYKLPPIQSISPAIAGSNQAIGKLNQAIAGLNQATAKWTRAIAALKRPNRHDITPRYETACRRLPSLPWPAPP